jgi:hypothetical protein
MAMAMAVGQSVEGAVLVLVAVLVRDVEHVTRKCRLREVRYGRKAKARQPHRMLVVQGKLTKFAIYNQ